MLVASWEMRNLSVLSHWRSSYYVQLPDLCTLLMGPCQTQEKQWPCPRHLRYRQLCSQRLPLFCFVVEAFEDIALRQGWRFVFRHFWRGISKQIINIIIIMMLNAMMTPRHVRLKLLNPFSRSDTDLATWSGMWTLTWSCWRAIICWWSVSTNLHYYDEVSVPPSFLNTIEFHFMTEKSHICG